MEVKAIVTRIILGNGGIGHHSSDLSFYQMMLINCLVFLLILDYF